MRALKIEKSCIDLNLQLTEKHMRDGNLKLAAKRVEDAGKSFKELLELMKKAD